MKIDVKILDLEHEEVSISERINDIEWEIQQQHITGSGSRHVVGLLDERRQAMDKLRYVRKELLSARKYKITGGGFDECFTEGAVDSGLAG